MIVLFCQHSHSPHRIHIFLFCFVDVRMCAHMSYRPYSVLFELPGLSADPWTHCSLTPLLTHEHIPTHPALQYKTKHCKYPNLFCGVFSITILNDLWVAWAVQQHFSEHSTVSSHGSVFLLITALVLSADTVKERKAVPVAYSDNPLKVNWPYSNQQSGGRKSEIILLPG